MLGARTAFLHVLTICCLFTTIIMQCFSPMHLRSRGLSLHDMPRVCPAHRAATGLVIQATVAGEALNLAPSTCVVAFAT